MRDDVAIDGGLDLVRGIIDAVEIVEVAAGCAGRDIFAAFQPRLVMAGPRGGAVAGAVDGLDNFLGAHRMAGNLEAARDCFLYSVYIVY